MNHTDIAVSEHVQFIAWTIEIATFIVAVCIAWIVWRISRRASKNKKSKKAE